LEAADTKQLNDFDMLLMSIIPHEYFNNFLQTEKPNFLPYMQEIHIGMLYIEDLKQLTDLESLKINHHSSDRSDSRMAKLQRDILMLQKKIM
jgi:hypothetical protein